MIPWRRSPPSSNRPWRRHTTPARAQMRACLLQVPRPRLRQFSAGAVLALVQLLASVAPFVSLERQCPRRQISSLPGYSAPHRNSPSRQQRSPTSTIAPATDAATLELLPSSWPFRGDYRTSESVPIFSLNRCLPLPLCKSQGLPACVAAQTAVALSCSQRPCPLAGSRADRLQALMDTDNTDLKTETEKDHQEFKLAWVFLHFTCFRATPRTTQQP